MTNGKIIFQIVYAVAFVVCSAVFVSFMWTSRRTEKIKQEILLMPSEFNVEE